jgi:signal transduction histidine kinase
MFRRFRHRLSLLLMGGILCSGAVALALDPSGYQAILVCTLGSTLVALICMRIARRYLHATLGRLRRVADDVGHGRPTATLTTQPGDDMYKLTSAVNALATRLAEAAVEEKRLHEELRRRERLAFLGELAASVAHEVNNPLDGVQNCARILRRSTSDPARAAQMLDLIDSGLGRIELIVRRLLTLAREHAIRPAPARVGDIVTAAAEVLRAKTEGRGITVQCDVETDDDRASVDRALLEQVFVNLLHNAADSMPAGGTITVTIRASEIPAATGPHPRICIDVADTGVGIPDDVLPHIFEPFFTTKTGGKGTGLGLAIAARIIDAHQGTIDVAPRPGGGTVFNVCIPREVPATGRAPERAAAVAAPGTS